VEYCLPIRQAENLLAFIRFRLVPGQELSPEDVEIYKSVGDEMALALKAGQARKTSFELHSSQVALAERRTVSHYLHDNLAQNLGYLRLKLDQLLMEQDQLSMDQVMADLARMRDAAKESYDVVRGTLETIHPRTLPHLMNLLQEHATRVSERAHFRVNFEVRGRPRPLKDDVQSAIFYVCHEALSNVEKHSKADCVDIIAEWRNDNFELTISDNGVGFNPQVGNRSPHFGLEIMNERINNINGQISFKTSKNAGTSIVIFVPITPIGHL
jgi:two-component system nitrate/nitrite sensor histidine kinase NarX